MAQIMQCLRKVIEIFLKKDINNEKIVLAILVYLLNRVQIILEGLSKPKLSKNMGEDYTAPTNQLNKTRELLDGASITFPTLTATGYAVVSTQPGQNIEQEKINGNKSCKNVCNERISRTNSWIKS